MSRECALLCVADADLRRRVGELIDSRSVDFLDHKAALGSTALLRGPNSTTKLVDDRLDGPSRAEYGTFTVYRGTDFLGCEGARS